MAKFRNPYNGYSQSVTQVGAFLGCLVFGGFYFAYKGVWKHFLIGWLAAVCTFGVSWFIYPFLAYECVRHSYLERGWKEVGRGKKTSTRARQGSTKPSFDFIEA
jgi:hypothetical protein